MVYGAVTHVNADPHLVVPGATTTTGMLVEGLCAHASNPRKSMELIVKIIRNLLDYPHDPKFRELRKTNAAIKEHIVDVKPCSQLLRRLGFWEMDDVFRLQASGIRGPEVARIQAAFHEFPELVDLVADLGPAIRAVNLQWSQANGTSTVIPFYQVVPKRIADIRRASEQLAQQEDAELQEALRLSQSETAFLSSGAGGAPSSFHGSASFGGHGFDGLHGRGGGGLGPANLDEEEDAELQEAIRLSRAAAQEDGPFYGGSNGSRCGGSGGGAGSSGSSGSSSAAASSASGGSGAASSASKLQPVEEEEDEDLLEALRLSKMDF
mmetsp:Transcript_150494/g.382609  ORF Transcript_150494/g.382609 Transcript_150494/m.382609 type:complete len:323 (+) Transcript_150494:191-1159(+)